MGHSRELRQSGLQQPVNFNIKSSLIASSKCTENEHCFHADRGLLTHWQSFLISSLILVDAVTLTDVMMRWASQQTFHWLKLLLFHVLHKIYLSGPQQVRGGSSGPRPPNFADPWFKTIISERKLRTSHCEVWRLGPARKKNVRYIIQFQRNVSHRIVPETVPETVSTTERVIGTGEK